MANNVYSTYEEAKAKAHERQKELERDIFICHTKYPSGEEFTLKTGDEVTCGSYLYMLKLSFDHHFASRKNAEREANRIAGIEYKPVWVGKKIEKENGYQVIKYYYLTYDKPCSISAH